MIKLGVIIEGLEVSDSCIICDREFTDTDFKVGDGEVISAEPLSPFGRFVKKAVRLFHKGTSYHVSCYYFRRYWDCPVKGLLAKIY